MTEQDIDNFILNRPHVVIIGAGATVAAIPNGDKNGLRCSVMNNFIETVGLQHILKDVELTTTSNNLEAIYSELYNHQKYKHKCAELEQAIIEYLLRLRLPDNPTIYDFLVLSLCEKDIIFSFNWDNLLIQAYQRVSHITKDLPQLIFLHGNVDLGQCPKCGHIEPYTNVFCRECHSKLNRPKIMFPVVQKNYTDDPYIKEAWAYFNDCLSNCSLLSIFGYGAPSSDAGAVSAMKKAFSETFRRLDRFEVIDIKDEEELRNTWQSFIIDTNDHIHIRDSYFKSFIAEFPRHTIEGYHKRYFKGWFGEGSFAFNNVKTFEELKQIAAPLCQDNFDVGVPASPSGFRKSSLRS